MISPYIELPAVPGGLQFHPAASAKPSLYGSEVGLYLG
jgi:hypothetical protein